MTARARIISARLVRALFWTWSAYLLFLVCAFYVRRWNVGRNHLESAWLIETALGLVSLALAPAAPLPTAGSDTTHRRVSWLLVLAFGQIGAWILYWRTLSIGLLATTFL